MPPLATSHLGRAKCWPGGCLLWVSTSQSSLNTSTGSFRPVVVSSGFRPKAPKKGIAGITAAPLIAALLAVPAGANDLLTCVDGAYFSGHAYLCDYVEGNVTPPEGKPPLTQITGAEETWFLESDYDCTTGIEIITWDMLLNKMGKGRNRVKSSCTPMIIPGRSRKAST